jgi:hypothetical protein
LFAHLFCLHPWDVDRLTVADFEAYRQAADEYQREMKKGG